MTKVISRKKVKSMILNDSYTITKNNTGAMALEEKIDILYRKVVAIAKIRKKRGTEWGEILDTGIVCQGINTWCFGYVNGNVDLYVKRYTES